MGTITKGLIGSQDVSVWTGTTSNTFSRPTSTGGTATMLKIAWPGVDLLAAYGAGTTRTDATLTAAMSSIGATNKARLWLMPGTWTISNDITITDNLTLVVPPGALITVATAKTLTIQGPIEAGPYQIFTGAGTVTISDTKSLRRGQWSSGGDNDLRTQCFRVYDTNGTVIHQMGEPD